MTTVLFFPWQEGFSGTKGYQSIKHLTVDDNKQIHKTIHTI